MKSRYPIITLCGSTRFKKEFEEKQKELTLDGMIVLSVGLFGHSGDDEVWDGKSEDSITETKSMDTINHSGGHYNDKSHPFIEHKGKQIYDPWFLFGDSYNGEPMPEHGEGDERIDPFRKYGKVAMARFVEEIIAARGERTSDGRLLINEG